MLYGLSVLLLLNCLVYQVVANFTDLYSGVDHTGKVDSGVDHTGKVDSGVDHSGQVDSGVDHTAKDVLYKERIVLHTRQGVLHNSVGVIATDGHHPHHINKREINTNVAGFSNAEKKAILNIHNALRAIERSSNMRKMSWSSQLEELAQAYAEQCIFDHSPKAYRKNIGEFEYIGENLYAGTAAFNVVSPIQMWWDETKFYDYNTLYCQPGQMCGHYTQVVWADSYALGCGVKYCPVLQKVDFGHGYNVVCHYGPGGNYVNQRPYRKGSPCVECPSELQFCVNGLCALRPQIGSPASSIHSFIYFNIRHLFLISSLYIYINALR